MTEPFDGITTIPDLTTGDHREPCPYQDLSQVISFEGFSYPDYYRGEREILQPRLEALGYTNVQWYMGEQDEFGPLSRVCYATKADGNIERFIYG
jgi:hypothetical protein